MRNTGDRECNFMRQLQAMQHKKTPSPQPSPQGERGKLRPFPQGERESAVVAAASLLPKGRGSPQRLRQRPFSQPHSLANAATLSCKLAKASLLGEGQDEGGLLQAIERIPYVRLARQFRR